MTLETMLELLAVAGVAVVTIHLAVYAERKPNPPKPNLLTSIPIYSGTAFLFLFVVADLCLTFTVGPRPAQTDPLLSAIGLAGLAAVALSVGVSLALWEGKRRVLHGELLPPDYKRLPHHSLKPFANTVKKIPADSESF